jgi:hypothetical protein
MSHVVSPTVTLDNPVYLKYRGRGTKPGDTVVQDDYTQIVTFVMCDFPIPTVCPSNDASRVLSYQ